MKDGTHYSGRVVAAARALTGISQADLAKAAGVPLSLIETLEKGGNVALPHAGSIDDITRALESFGAIFIPEGDGFGAGVRFRFTRQDNRQIGRLEGEGGIVKEDDVP
jgi:transcriptional regulator with XRE-family HTH domain